jgi:hypothetical protein
VNSEGKIHTVFFQTEHGEQPGKSHACSTIFCRTRYIFRKKKVNPKHIWKHLSSSHARKSIQIQVFKNGGRISYYNGYKLLKLDGEFIRPLAMLYFAKYMNYNFFPVTAAKFSPKHSLETLVGIHQRCVTN